MPFSSERELARAIIKKYDLQPTLLDGLTDYISNYQGKSVGYWNEYLSAIGCHIEEGIVLDFSNVSDPLPDVDRAKLPPPYRCPECVKLRKELAAVRKRLKAAENTNQEYVSKVHDLAVAFGVFSSERIPHPLPVPPPLPVHETTPHTGRRLSGTQEPLPGKNHSVPCGAWGRLRNLAEAIDAKFGGGINGHLQRLTNYWCKARGTWCRANPQTREKYQSIGIVFDDEGYVADCSSVPRPLP